MPVLVRPGLPRIWRPVEHRVRVTAELPRQGLASLALLVILDVGDDQLEESGEDEVAFGVGEFHAPG